MKKKMMSILMVIILLITTVSLQKDITVEAKNKSKYTTTTQNVKAKLGRKVVLRPIVYKDGKKVNLKSKDYTVVWIHNCKYYGSPLNNGTKHVIKKLKAIDCYNSSFKSVYGYIVLYKNKEVLRGYIHIIATGKNKVGKATIKKIRVEEDYTSIYFKELYNATDYEVQYSLDKNFKRNKAVKKQPYAGCTDLDNQKLEKGQTYFVRVRGFSIINKKKRYGKWSKAKTFLISQKASDDVENQL